MIRGAMASPKPEHRIVDDGDRDFEIRHLRRPARFTPSTRISMDFFSAPKDRCGRK
jgi:hypothetical protein